MRISWVIADTAAIDPTIDSAELKNVGPLWGGWRTWRAFQTDNVVCYSFDKSQELVTRQFQTRCNLYVAAKNFAQLDRPNGVQLFHGEFPEEIDRQDEIVSLHLASTQSDIVIMLGFDLSDQTIADKLAKHNHHVRQHLIKNLMQTSATVQWVILDQTRGVAKMFKELPNFTVDTLPNVLKMFSS